MQQEGLKNKFFNGKEDVSGFLLNDGVVGLRFANPTYRTIEI